jgi:hypothetical protein
MPSFICTTCGTQYAESDQPPAECAICQDERQYVKKTGQQWMTLDQLRLTNRNSIRFEEPGLIGFGIDPPFAIGQRALFLRTPRANVLWDCLPLLDEAVVEMVRALGGVSAIAISHPVVHWAGGAGGKGALLTGDILQVVADRKHVSFMWSYPNHVPLPAATIERIVQAVEPFAYDRVYGAFWDAVIERDGQAAVRRSAERYQRALA